ncbi:MAG TPA: guanylate kinase [Bacilli bacterium]|jgi:guanylate kinase|nr:guanylate kinase [Acholeplasmataceae bacterium]HNZ77152.1 guanylate kinase [Bacilli bacterium]HOD60839.1 guanylate kinase [Bacilli bacterium]HOE06579.1 guanylate kinase [Bacilli bacterium]HOH62267.1 guanylate kinase [Bacilli bacterium]
MKLNDKGLLIVISGPSGVGKGTIRSALFEMEGHDLIYSVSLTTRKPRAEEVNGREYWFISKEEFEQRIKDNKMLEYAEFVGNYYGTPLDTVEEQLKSGKEVVLEIEVNGAMQVREKMSDAVFIFIAPPSYEALEKRLKSRGTEDSEHIKERIEKAKKELDLAYQYDYIVVNDEVKNAADKIMAIIRAEHAKTERTIHKYNSLLEVKNND